VARQPQLKAGKLSVTGSGSWSGQSFFLGSIRVARSGFQDKTVTVKPIRSRKFSVDPQKILLENGEIAARRLQLPCRGLRLANPGAAGSNSKDEPRA
jgi:hypothetical protein